MKLCKISNPVSGADMIFNVVAETCDFYKDQNGELYMVYSNGTGYKLVYLSNASESKQLFYQLFFVKNNKTVKSGDVTNAYGMICALVEDTATEIPVFLRIAQLNNTIFYDLHNSAEQVVEITEKGVCIIQKSTIKDCFFKSNTTLKEQKLPVDSEYKLIDFVNDFVNVSDSQKILLLAYICIMFLPDVLRPILIVQGEKGAGKTSFLKNLSGLVCPVTKDVLVLPDDVDNLVTTLSNNYFCIFDNVGRLNTNVMNLLCQASTGGTMIKRKLFSDNSEIAINIKRLVALNGINLEIQQINYFQIHSFVVIKKIIEKAIIS